MIYFLLLCAILVGQAVSFAPPMFTTRSSCQATSNFRQQLDSSVFSSSTTSEDETSSSTAAAATAAIASPPPRPAPPSDVDPKEVVKIFGRLAERYIMLDESGGMCCYSACKDCEYRLPDGGYRMADQSASRPKWIPVYEDRVFANVNKEHVAKWKIGLFGTDADDGSDGESNFVPSLSKEEFVAGLVDLEFAPPLGGPFVSKTAATIEDTALAEYLFDVLSNGKEKLSRFKMSLGLKDLADGEQGLTWATFSEVMGV
mmetsp:Transcript_16498/g.40205  ORF Transcript_16498/g.40205 Transcript_16498/m.40205 type:complete len:258 (-) Transcript_16498:182-955(-)